MGCSARWQYDGEGTAGPAAETEKPIKFLDSNNQQACSKREK